MASEIILSYKVKLFPTRVKADTLAALAALFARLHADATTSLAGQEQPRQPSSKGKGKFTERAYRRATADFRRAIKAARAVGRPYKLPYLRAELIDAAEIQIPRRAKSFDLWIRVQGAGLVIPARKHKALNRTLALPGATIGKCAMVFRKNNKWYASIPVTVPSPEPYQAQGWLGCDVGVRKSVTRSDGYKGPDLRPILKKQKLKNAERQRQGLDRSLGHQSPQRQQLLKEARATVSVAQRSGRGVAVEDPGRLPRWKQWAGRVFGYRVLLLCALLGVPARVIAPPYTSCTCPRCGSVEPGQRHRETFRCWRCGYITNADFVGALNVCHGASRLDCVSHRVPLVCATARA